MNTDKCHNHSFCLLSHICLTKTCCKTTECECHSPFNASNEKDEVAIDFGAVDKSIDIAGIHRLSRLQASCSYAITH